MYYFCYYSYHYCYYCYCYYNYYFYYYYYYYYYYCCCFRLNNITEIRFKRRIRRKKKLSRKVASQTIQRRESTRGKNNKTIIKSEEGRREGRKEGGVGYRVSYRVNERKGKCVMRSSECVVASNWPVIYPMGERGEKSYYC